MKDVWYKLKTSLLDTAKEVYGTSKNHQWKKETWCWKDKVDEAFKQKRTRFKIYKALDNESKSNEVEKAKAAYTEAKSEVWKVRTEAEKDKFANILPNNGSIFKIAKQMDRANQDVLGEKCIESKMGSYLHLFVMMRRRG